ncbi:hypothetical protein FE257_007870 [Aspergillus nanangensis]|uniref:Clr5 domain-containing protein n=1 Tax=Aspergillus nanangensis TaxID=2582783 RepID=A0AAD4CXL0_ASPNN|nr:hypothetical protein FE257_007870 [Aspergillus nanangensis]
MDGSIPPSSALSASPSSSSSAIFRPRRSDDWQQYRDTIEKLYRDDQLKLRDVKRIMERDYNFVASEKQYKDRLAAWNIRKNIKAKEVHVMIRKQQKRAARGKQTAFRVGGQEVDSKRIARFVRRYGVNWDNNPPEEARPTSPEPSRLSLIPRHRQSTNSVLGVAETPSDMSYYTPDPDERGATLSPLPEMQSFSSKTAPFCSVVSAIGTVGAILGPVRTRTTQINSWIGDAKFDPMQDIEDDTQSLSTTLSPSLPADTPRPTDDSTPAEDPWSELISFQDRLLVLHHTLEKSMSGFTSPHEDGNYNQ